MNEIQREKYAYALEVIKLGVDNVPEELYYLAVSTIKELLFLK